MKLRRIRQVSAHESLPRSGKNIVHAPTHEQYGSMLDRLTHGESVFSAVHPKLADDYDFEEYLLEHPGLLDLLSYDLAPGEEPARVSINAIRELLAGPKHSVRDLLELSKNPDIWHVSDVKLLNKIRVSGKGCWEIPKYVDHIEPNRARYSQPYAYSYVHREMRKQMGAAWMWERIIGPIPEDTLPDGKRAFRPDHRCNNKSCVYPRHTVLGRSEVNDAFTTRMEMMASYEGWTTSLWARPSFAYPDGLARIVHESEVEVLSDRSVILPVSMSRKEFDACTNTLTSAPHLPDGGWTTDPGYHVLFGAVKRGLIFDDVTGCWNAQFDLNLLSPHKKTIAHACGNAQCCNIRHMDITDSHKQYYMLQHELYITVPDGRIVNTATGEFLPPYWESWMLYWDWLKKYSGSPSVDHETELVAEKYPLELLSETDFEHIWVHPLTGCWENERFYPRWTANGVQQNAYGFHRSGYGELGRSTHRYLLYKYFESIGEKLTPNLTTDADHRCGNRRCCNPLHMQFVTKPEHSRVTADRSKYPKPNVRSKVARNIRLRNPGR